MEIWEKYPDYVEREEISEDYWEHLIEEYVKENGDYYSLAHIKAETYRPKVVRPDQALIVTPEEEYALRMGFRPFKK